MTDTEQQVPTRKIFAHHDADGITSALFLQYGIGEELEVVFPEKFGDTSKWVTGSYMVDMRPRNPDIEGIVIDHHLPHPEHHKYELISAEYPASLITWETYKDKIPKKEWWKLAVGLSGDGQPELMPTEVYKEHPSLLKTVKSSLYQRYGRWTASMFPIYKLLSSMINAYLRKGEYESAFNLLKYSKSPMNLYTSEDARIAKADVKNEYMALLKDSEIVDYGNLAIVLFSSKYRMSGYVGSSLQDVLSNKTIMAINKRNGSLSLRGDLATYYRDILKPLDYLEIDGHSAFMGGKCTKNYNDLLEDLDKLL